MLDGQVQIKMVHDLPQKQCTKTHTIVRRAALGKKLIKRDRITPRREVLGL